MLERVTQVLDAFADGPERLLLDDVVGITGLPQSTAFRLLRQLVGLGWVEHVPPGYRLGPRLPVRQADTERLRAAASPHLTELHLATEAVVHLSVLEGDAVHYLDKVGGAASATVPSRVGARIVASDTVSGRVLLAAIAPELVDQMISPTRPVPLSDGDDLHLVLRRVRERGGLAHSSASSNSSRISSLAGPVLGPGGPVAAISVACRGELPAARFAPLVTRAARATGEALSRG